MEHSNYSVVTFYYLTMSRNKTCSGCIRFWGRLLPSLKRVKQSSFALFMSEAMLVYILVMQACPDLYSFTSHIHSTTSNQPRSQRVPSQSPLYGSSFPATFSFSLPFFPLPFLILTVEPTACLYSVSGPFASKF